LDAFTEPEETDFFVTTEFDDSTKAGRPPERGSIGNYAYL